MTYNLGVHVLQSKNLQDQSTESKYQAMKNFLRSDKKAMFKGAVIINPTVGARAEDNFAQLEKISHPILNIPKIKFSCPSSFSKIV